MQPSRFKDFFPKRSPSGNGLKKWILSVREQFDCDKEPTSLKIWEYFLLIGFAYSKEILNFFIYVFSTDEDVHNLTSAFNLNPLNLDIVWTILLKLIPGYILLFYFLIKHKKSNSKWHVCVFLMLSVFKPVISSFESKYDLVNGLTNIFTLILHLLFIVYFFATDPVHLDSLKMLLWDNLDIDAHTGRVFKTPSSRISVDKVRKLIFSVFLIIFAAILSIMLITQIISWINRPSSTSGAGTSPEEPEKPKNQQHIEKMFNINMASVVLGSLLIAPIQEEWVYRRFIMKSGQNRWWTILVSGFIFGLIHLREREGLLTIIPYAIPGLVFGTAYYISNNIWHSLIAHSMYNLFTLIKMLMMSRY